MAGQVARLLRLPPGIAPDGRRWPDGRKEGVRPSDIAVLCRKRVQFPLLRQAIEDRGIPVEVVGLGGLLTVPEVAGPGGDAARAARPGRWRRAGPAAHRPPLADRPPGPDRARPPLPEARQDRGRRCRDGGGRRDGGRDGDDGADALAKAVADLTADAGSLIEAIDDLGDPAAYSPDGYARLSALGAELRVMRGHVGRPLADLVAEVERALSLDIEVAARPGADPAAARADLDAFAGTAAAFATDQEEPTLGAFLAYLAAAQEEEFGLEAGRVGETDTVKLVTVHAAKGLQWAAVVVPGLAAGDRSQVFPARPRLTTRWTDNARLLPFGLRGDAPDLPVLPGLDTASLRSFADDCADPRAGRGASADVRGGHPRRVLAHCSGYWWGEGVSPLGPSPFLDEIADACRQGAGTIAHWAPAPEPGAENPALAEPAEASWPAAASGDRYDAVREAAALVTAAMADAGAGETAEPGDGALEDPGSEPRRRLGAGRQPAAGRARPPAW